MQKFLVNICNIVIHDLVEMARCARSHIHTYIHTRFLIQSSSVHEVGTQGFCSKSRILYTDCAARARYNAGVVARAAFVAITFIMGDL